jgi:hypothetical protein
MMTLLTTLRDKPKGSMIAILLTSVLVPAFITLSCRGGDKPARADISKDGKIPLPAIVEVTAEAGLADFRHDNGARGKFYFPEQMGAGGGFIDYDGDSWLDILLVGGGAIDPEPTRFVKALRLYKNDRDGTFSEVTEAAGLGGLQAHGTGVAAADYDNDGDEDFYFTTLWKNFLFRNDGGKFTSVGDEAGVTDQAVWSSSSLFFDADLDGDLDLYVANYSDWSQATDVYCSVEGGKKVYCPPGQYHGIPSRFYRNHGNGRFADETEESGFLAAIGKSLGVAEFDYNRDGWPDFVVSNDGEGDLLYKNNGDGTFSEIGMISGMGYGENGEARAGMGIDVGVVDDDGYESVFVGNFSNEMIGVYRYIGNDLFMNRAAVSKIGQASLLSLTFGLFLFDIEYDGDLDLFAANGHVYPERPILDGSTYRQKSQLFVNIGNGTFSPATSVPGGAFEQEMVARGASYGDYDRDGDLDILLTENGGPAHLWRNELANAKYLRVRLQGLASNTEGISSQVIAVVGNRRMYRRMRTGSSYLCQSEKVVSFGLGPAEKVDSLIVHWPSGARDVLTDLKPNQDLRIVEGSGRSELVYFPTTGD